MSCVVDSVWEVPACACANSAQDAREPVVAAPSPRLPRPLLEPRRQPGVLNTVDISERDHLKRTARSLPGVAGWPRTARGAERRADEGPRLRMMMPLRAMT